MSNLHKIKDDWLVEYMEDSYYDEVHVKVGVFKDMAINDIIPLLPLNNRTYKFTSINMLVDNHLLFVEEKGQSKKEYLIIINEDYDMDEDTNEMYAKHFEQKFETLVKGDREFKVKYVDPLESARKKLSKQELAAIANLVKDGKI